MTDVKRPSSPDGLIRGGKQRIITISGANKDIGKSSLAAYLAARCRECGGIKVTVHEERPAGEAVVEETEASASPGTDTARMAEAGACPVFWVRTTAEALAGDFEQAMSRMGSAVVIVEGNSILRHIDPDYAVFIMGPTFADFKPSAFGAIAKAHTVVVNGDRKLPGSELLELEREIKKLNERAKMVVVSEVGEERAWDVVASRAAGAVGGGYMSAEVDEKVVKAVKDKAREGRISCAVALKLAEELKVPALEVGKAANAANVKIAKCSLGCF